MFWTSSTSKFVLPTSSWSSTPCQSGLASSRKILRSTMMVAVSSKVVFKRLVDLHSCGLCQNDFDSPPVMRVFLALDQAHIFKSL